MPKGLAYRCRLRRAGLAAALLALAGCGVGPFPRRVPGSDVTLPPSTGEWLLGSLVGCAAPVVTKGVAGARDAAATCRTATGDTVPDLRGPAPAPPATVP